MDKKFFEAIGIEEDLSWELDEATVARLIELALDEREHVVIEQYYGISRENQTRKFIGQYLGGISIYQVTRLRDQALVKLRSPSTTKALKLLAEDRRWLRKDKDLQNLRDQVKDLEEKFTTLSAAVSRIRKTPQIVLV